MARIVFYEKPGCAGNARQKDWLRAAGHELDVRDLLTEAWTHERLLGFLAALPVSDWFNRSAPDVREGRLVPERLSPAAALDLLLSQPLLIRRPLMEDSTGHRVAGFDPAQIDAWIGLSGLGVPPGMGAEGCAATLPGSCPIRHSD